MWNVLILISNRKFVKIKGLISITKEALEKICVNYSINICICYVKTRTSVLKFYFGSFVKP